MFTRTIDNLSSTVLDIDFIHNIDDFSIFDRKNNSYIVLVCIKEREPISVEALNDFRY